MHGALSIEEEEIVSEGDQAGVQEGVLEVVLGLPEALGATSQAAGDTEPALWHLATPYMRQLLWRNVMLHPNLSSCAVFELCALQDHFNTCWV